MVHCCRPKNFHSDVTEVNPVRDDDLGRAGMSFVYQCGLPGPHLDCLGAFSPKGHRVLEARVRNRRGVLPTSLILLQEGQQKTQVRSVFSKKKLPLYS